MIYVMIIIRVCYLYRIEHVIGRGDLPYELCWRSSDVRERAGSSLPGSRARRAVQARLRCGQRQYHDQHQYSHCDTITLSTNQLLFINIYYLHLPTTIKHRNSFKKYICKHYSLLHSSYTVPVDSNDFSSHFTLRYNG